jgi:prevent-host-death family protein
MLKGKTQERRIRFQPGRLTKLREQVVIRGGRTSWAKQPRAAAGISIVDVATCSYNWDMPATGIRELKNNLSRYVRRVESGERIAITAHGRVVAELVPPGTGAAQRRRSRFDELVSGGAIRPPLEPGDPLEDWPDIRLPAGTAAELIDRDRGDA